MNGFEFNKIFAAVLVAGIAALSTGLISRGVFHTEEVVAHGSETVAKHETAVPQGPEPVLALIASADAEKGRALGKACAACHTLDKGGANGVGPNLWDILNRGRAAHAGYVYSDGMKALGGKWDYITLNKFLWKPKSVIAGTKMTFAGIKKPEDRAAVIAWLRTEADSPPALPSGGEISAEEAELVPAPAAGVADAPAEAAEKH